MSSIEQRSSHQCTTQLELIWEYTYMNFKVVDMWLESNQTTFLQSARVSNSGRSRQNSLGSTAKPVRYVSEVQILCLYEETINMERYIALPSLMNGETAMLSLEKGLLTLICSLKVKGSQLQSATSHKIGIQKMEDMLWRRNE